MFTAHFILHSAYLFTFNQVQLRVECSLFFRYKSEWKAVYRGRIYIFLIIMKEFSEFPLGKLNRISMLVHVIWEMKTTYSTEIANNLRVIYFHCVVTALFYVAD